MTLPSSTNSALSSVLFSLRQLTRSAALASLVLLTPGCELPGDSEPAANPQAPGNAHSPGEGSGTASAYLVTGVATDARGNPVPNAEITLRNAVYVADVRTQTDADGSYQVNVPDGSWIAEANVGVLYHGVEYCLSARPSSTEAIWAQDGAVRDFTFLIAGENPRGGEPYGGELEITPYLGEGIPHASTQTVLFTLTPDGPLIDGSAGETLSGEVQFKHENFSANIFNLYDIPFGRYRVSAAWKQPDGSYQPLSVRTISSQSATYGTNIIQFDGGMLGCGAKYYSQIEISL